MTINLDPTAPPLTVQEVAPVLAVSVDTIYDAVHRGEIRAQRLGRTIRIPRAEVARLLLANDEGAAPTAAPHVTADRSAAVAGESNAG